MFVGIHGKDMEEIYDVCRPTGALLAISVIQDLFVFPFVPHTITWHV